MAKFFSVIGLVALATFSWAQYRSWSLFDDVAAGQPIRSSGNASRFYHK